MEIYILDDLLRREAVVDRFESFIWTEKYAAYGDFKLHIHATVENKRLFPEGTLLGINNSKRVMMVETVLNKDDSEGRSVLEISGRSLEGILEERPNRASGIATGGTATNKVVTTYKPGDIARWWFDTICRNNAHIAADQMPFITAGTLYPVDTIAEPDTVVSMEFGYKSLYATIKEVCDIYGLGFRLYKGMDTSKLYFNVYAGSDRTTSQQTLPAVIFSPDLDNMRDSSSLNSIEKYKNVAYVMAKNGSRIVYTADSDENTVGFNRRVLYVDANDIELAAGTALQDALEQRGKDELAKNKAISAIDGEITTNSIYKYEVDYFLGDLVEMRDSDGVTHRMRITEQIFVDDAEGERSYPTLSADLFITPGSWYAWDYSGVWDTALGTWIEQP